MRNTSSALCWLIGFATGVCAIPAKSWSIPLPYTAPWAVVFTPPTGTATGAWGAGLVPPIAQGAIAPGSLAAANFFARAEATASTSVFFDSDFAAETVTFNRPFTLPAGGPYKVSLTARALGILTIDNAANDSATVVAKVCVSPVGGAAIFCVDNLDNPNFSLTDPPAANGVHDTLFVTDSASPVAAGNYEVKGFLAVSALVGGNGNLLGDDAISNYLFASEDGFEGFGEYDLIPEPGGILPSVSIALGWIAYLLASRSSARRRDRATR